MMMHKHRDCLVLTSSVFQVQEVKNHIPQPCLRVCFHIGWRTRCPHEMSWVGDRTCTASSMWMNVCETSTEYAQLDQANWWWYSSQLIPDLPRGRAKPREWMVSSGQFIRGIRSLVCGYLLYYALLEDCTSKCLTWEQDWISTDKRRWKQLN